MRIEKSIDLLYDFVLSFYCSYYKLDHEKTIKENFKHKTIIEYPIFYVAIDGKDDEFKTRAFENTAV